MLKAFDKDVLYYSSRSSQNVNFKAMLMAEAASRDVLVLMKKDMSDRNHHYYNDLLMHHPHIIHRMFIWFNGNIWWKGYRLYFWMRDYNGRLA